MVNKYLECLSVEGNYSKARIGCLLMAIFSIAVFIWLVVLTAQISNAKKGEDDNEPKLECMTKDKKKCVFPFLDGDSQHDKCEWKDTKFECATEVDKDNKLASVGDCLYQCELKVEGYTQKFLYDEKKLLSCSNKQHVKINPKLNTMGCKDLCDKEKDCKFFYTTDSKYCVTYKSCDEHRTVTGRAGTTFQKIEDGTTAAPTDAPTAAPTDATTAAPTDAPTAATTDAPTTPSDPVNPTVPTPTVEPTKGCPEGWYHKEGEGELCFDFARGPFGALSVNYTEAVKYCEGKGAILAEPKDNEKMTTLWTLMERYNEKTKFKWMSFWIGISPVNQTNPTTSSDYKWNSNQEVITYNAWADKLKNKQPIVIKNKEACVVVTTTYNEPLWETYRCHPKGGLTERNVVCQKKPL